MPIYQYECESCGSFDVMRSIADRDLPHLCPECGVQTIRAITSTAMLSLMPQSQRDAYATNERSANAPTSSKSLGYRHGPGCACCKPKASSADAARPSMKSPAGRPWMISH
ncbi:zinc ribbon domain-containing protein [Caballeronia sp. LZ029]|uniref:FmdB family zinc ribbon protein n=1 Tax=Caballeronia sp. LZ029 TaxID=3038564 RepID=UPI0004595180|nr:zinc ribbon domain-containing protein [Caballeronia sp. LZ029]KAK44285.1 FmdB family transcriptional regulator [Caballeronia jiangsuensis]MDR5747724.1 zinc ribbon domain-containing protein [Caballeronia sp. LZ029]